ncbi:major facilitator superfamily domain-containing protein 10 isoform X5 [Salvelinus namaycush]|uniref:Major facilitator superfamily domain-containing protein 10 isoform X5 n=1 Tax=Salvelinus namaycush TaxID=8040 RepID=A0A8U1C367_SALNM|nr:major facilitator superfamily domain-containing protein 10 isoform X5 [Salvelinus namaycush]
MPLDLGKEFNQKGGMSSETGSEEAIGSSRVIKSVFFALLLDLLGFTLILPLLPSILDHYGQTEDSVYQSLQSIVDWFREAVGVPMETKYNSVLFGGLIGSLFSLLQFMSSPLTGAASDHYGRKPLLILTTLGLMSSYAVWAVSCSFSMFLLSRVIGGICKGNVSLCTAMIADLPCPKARNKGMMMVGIAFSLGFTVGPLMGAYFAINSSKEEVFYHGPAVLALVFSAADLLFIIVMLPETLPKQNKTQVSSVTSGIQESGDLLNPVALFHFSALTRTEDPPSKEKMQNLKVLGLVYFTYLFLFSGLEFTLSFLTHQRFQFTSMQQGKMFFFMGITMALIQGGYARRIKPGHHIRTVRLFTGLLEQRPASLSAQLLSSYLWFY